MRVLALVVASLVSTAASLPAIAACPYKDQVAQSEIQKGHGGDRAETGAQSRG